jgi:hypothetical protein
LKFLKHKARTIEKLNNKYAISVLELSIQKWPLKTNSVWRVIGTTHRFITTSRGMNKALQDSNWIIVTVFLSVLEKYIWNLPPIPSPSASPLSGN